MNSIRNRIIIGSDREGLGLGLGSDRRSEPNTMLRNMIQHVVWTATAK